MFSNSKKPSTSLLKLLKPDEHIIFYQKLIRKRLTRRQQFIIFGIILFVVLFMPLIVIAFLPPRHFPSFQVILVVILAGIYFVSIIAYPERNEELCGTRDRLIYLFEEKTGIRHTKLRPIIFKSKYEDIVDISKTSKINKQKWVFDTAKTIAFFCIALSLLFLAYDIILTNLAILVLYILLVITIMLLPLLSTLKNRYVIVNVKTKKEDIIIPFRGRKREKMVEEFSKFLKE